MRDKQRACLQFTPVSFIKVMDNSFIFQCICLNFTCCSFFSAQHSYEKMVEGLNVCKSVSVYD